MTPTIKPSDDIKSRVDDLVAFRLSRIKVFQKSKFFLEKEFREDPMTWIRAILDFLDSEETVDAAN